MRRLILRHEQKTFPRIVRNGSVVSAIQPLQGKSSSFADAAVSIEDSSAAAARGRVAVSLAEKKLNADFSLMPGSVELVIAGFYYRFALSSFQGEGVSGRAATELRSEIPGRIVKILVQAGAVVAAGDPLLIHEAMKMEMTLRAPAKLSVKEILVQEGAQVEADMVLMRFAGAKG